jgi:thymidylate kinase
MSEVQLSGDLAPFFVLLGPDYSGKSSIMTKLTESMPGWRFISADDNLLPPGCEPIAKLRRILVKETLPSLGGSFSPDFVIAVMQTAIVHLRDQLAARGSRPALVDSYYYKTLAKCRLMIKDENPMFTWWRSFPQPRRVLYLDVAPEFAWQRSRSGVRVNRLEHYGLRPCRDSFATYQADLRRVMLEEVRHLPVHLIDGEAAVTRTARAVKEALSSECG